MVNKKYDEVRQVLEKIAKFNKTRLDDTLWVAFLVIKSTYQRLKVNNPFVCIA